VLLRKDVEGPFMVRRAHHERFWPRCISLIIPFVLSLSEDVPQRCISGWEGGKNNKYDGKGVRCHQSPERIQRLDIASKAW
ncbi:MAG: hypothetical protein WBC82_09775, partial [Dehalococcoidia bacterium]